MATTSFTKNFKITRRDSDKFIDMMSNTNKKDILKNDFVSNYNKVKKGSSLFNDMREAFSK